RRQLARGLRRRGRHLGGLFTTGRHSLGGIAPRDPAASSRRRARTGRRARPNGGLEQTTRGGVAPDGNCPIGNMLAAACAVMTRGFAVSQRRKLRRGHGLETATETAEKTRPGGIWGCTNRNLPRQSMRRTSADLKSGPERDVGRGSIRVASFVFYFPI